MFSVSETNKAKARGSSEREQERVSKDKERDMDLLLQLDRVSMHLPWLDLRSARSFSSANFHLTLKFTVKAFGD